MHALYQNSVSSNIRNIRSIIKSFGITVQTGNNLKIFSELVASQPLRHKMAPAFDPNTLCMPHVSALWMVAYKEDGEIVCTQAIKLLDLGQRNLEQYLSENIWEIHPFGFDPEVSDARCFLSEESRNITGYVTYHGELWLKGGPQGVRGGSLAILMTRLILLESIARWSPDFLIGLQSPVTACRGLSIKEGYMRLEQRSVIWYKEQKQELLEGWLVWMTGKEARFNLRIPANLFVDLFESDGRSKARLQTPKVA